MILHVEREREKIPENFDFYILKISLYFLSTTFRNGPKINLEFYLEELISSFDSAHQSREDKFSKNFDFRIVIKISLHFLLWWLRF